MTQQQQVGIFFSLESITVVIIYLSYFSNFYIPSLCWDYDRYIKRGAFWPQEHVTKQKRAGKELEK